MRRLAARDDAIDIIGMEVIWTPELAAAGWILPWPDGPAERARAGRLGSAIESASFEGRLWAAPFTTNTPTGSIAAASVVVTLPVTLLVLLFQRRIVSGLTAGAVKG